MLKKLNSKSLVDKGKSVFNNLRNDSLLEELPRVLANWMTRQKRWCIIICLALLVLEVFLLIFSRDLKVMVGVLIIGIGYVGLFVYRYTRLLDHDYYEYEGVILPQKEAIYQQIGWEAIKNRNLVVVQMDNGQIISFKVGKDYKHLYPDMRIIVYGDQGVEEQDGSITLLSIYGMEVVQNQKNEENS